VTAPNGGPGDDDWAEALASHEWLKHEDDEGADHCVMCGIGVVQPEAKEPCPCARKAGAK